jgi:hypothetical protein
MHVHCHKLLSSAVSFFLFLFPIPIHKITSMDQRAGRHGTPSLVTMRQMKEFTYSQMKIMVATLLYFFMFKLADESKEATYKILTSFFFLLSLLTFFVYV